MVTTDRLNGIRKLEEETFNNLDISMVNDEVEDSTEVINRSFNPQGKFEAVLNALPTIKGGELSGLLDPLFWRYYKMPWGKPFFYEYTDPFNDLIIIIYGSRGGGKTGTGSTINIVDGMMKGIPVISNVPIAWVAKDYNNKLYKIESIPFDIEKFARGDSSFYFKRLLLDEGNYLADRLRSTSNKNLAMTDILQQARKFRMSITFCTINWMWIDPRVTGSLCDITMKCADMYYDHYYRRKNHLRKGEWISVNATDESGKVTGQQGTEIDTGTINLRKMFGVFDTNNFVDPIQARRKLQGEAKMIFDEYGKEVKKSEWLEKLKHKLVDLVNSGLTQWKSKDLWAALMIDDDGLRKIAGRYMARDLGIERSVGGNSIATYDLSVLCE